MKPNRQVRVGLIGVGAGSIAQQVHLPSLRRIPQAEIVAVASRSRADIGLPVAQYTAWQEMLDREQIDLLYVMTPTATHVPIVMSALQRGIHVMCEKPPAASVDETRALLDTARMNKRNLMFCYNRRFAPSYVRFKRLAVERGCDTLVCIKTRGQIEPITPPVIARMVARARDLESMQLGPIFEFMPHLFDLALWINGAVRDYSFSARRLYDSPVNLSAHGYLEHVNGARSVFVYETFTGRATEQVTLYGPALTAEVSGGMFDPNQLRVDDRGRTEIFASPDDPLVYGGFLPMSQYLVRCILEGTPVEHDATEIIESVRLALAFDRRQVERVSSI